MPSAHCKEVNFYGFEKKIVQLAKMIGGLPGMVNKIDENAPEYYSLECVVTDDMADVALAAGLRKARTIAYLAEKSGKSLDETTRLAHQLGETGVFTIWKDKTDGLERCYVEIFAPGILERMVGNREQLARTWITGKTGRTPSPPAPRPARPLVRPTSPCKDICGWPHKGNTRMPWN